MSEQASLNSNGAGTRWSNIERLIAQIADDSKRDVSFEDFADRSLGEIMLALSATAGAVWVVKQHAGWEQASQANYERWSGAADEQVQNSHQEFLESVLASGCSSTRCDALTGHAWIAAPFSCEHQAGVIEVIRAEPIDPQQRTGAERLLTLVADLFADQLRRSQWRQLRLELNDWQQYETLVARIQGSLDLHETGFQIVNDGRVFVGCDRASLLVARGKTMTTLAISGVDSFERRSQQIRSLESLAGAVGVSRRWLRYEGSTEELPPQLEIPVTKFADASHSQSVDVIPLIATHPSVADETQSAGKRSDDLLGVLVLERFSSLSDSDADPKIIRLSQLSSLALRNSLDYSTLPFLSLARRARRLTRLGTFGRWRAAIWTGIATVVTACVCLIPIPFSVYAEGELHPKVRRDLFSPEDAEVAQVHSGHGDMVQRGDVLITLQSRELERELQGLQGQYQATQKKLSGLTAARIRADSREVQTRFPGQLAAEEEELKELLSSQEKQIAIVRKQHEWLTVRSPIHGRVLTWNTQERLEDRPVTRGQRLLRVADTNGPWVVELSVPDRDIAHVIAADRETSDALLCSFTPAGSDDHRYHATVESIAGRTEVLDGKTATVRVVATIETEKSLTLRPGATVFARVDCGTRSLGYVLFHDLFQTIRRVLWF